MTSTNTNTNTHKPVTPVFVSGNAGKIKEVQEILGDHIHAVKLDLVEIQGNSADIVRAKCIEAYKQENKPVLIEDTSLGFNALEQLPGVYIKWFLDRLGLDGLVKLLAGHKDKSAEAMCQFGYYDGQSFHYFTGVVEGTIVDPRGSWAFGWDAIFQPNGFTKTFGEMTAEEKNAVSHRRRALDKVGLFLGKVVVE